MDSEPEPKSKPPWPCECPRGHRWLSEKTPTPKRCAVCDCKMLRKPLVASASNTLPESDQIVHLRAELVRMGRDVQKARDAAGQIREMADRVAAAVVAVAPFPRLAVRADKRGKESPMHAVLKLSDWHIGARISAEETSGFGSFDWEIARRRVALLGEKFLKWIATHRSSFHIPVLHVFCEGDWVSGNIHQELLSTNEFPLPEQTAKAGLLLGELVAHLAPHFPEVRLVEVGADNHGRLQPKPQSKQKAANNMSYLVYHIANCYLAKHGNVQSEIVPGINALVEVNKVRFLVEHGDTIQGWAGTPYYGMDRKIAKEALRRMRSDYRFDYISI